MTPEEIVATIEGELLFDSGRLLELEYAFSSDLMSDVLAYAHSGMLMITGLTHRQAIRTAEMADIPAILFVRGKYPSEQILALAREVGITLMTSPFTMFETAGRLYQAGLKGIGKLPLVQHG